jgi:tetratricopeptide (TPR) repeat protein
LRNRYWVDPRLLEATFQMHLGRYRLAKPEIDTCLMLAPYRQESHVNLYGYYRDTRDFTRALQAAERAAELFPGSPEIIRDLMILYFTTDKHAVADSLASVLMDLAPEFPQPYLIKGLKAEALKNPADAVDNYEQFLQLAPRSAEAADVRRRLDSLRTLMRQPAGGN